MVTVWLSDILRFGSTNAGSITHAGAILQTHYDRILRVQAVVNPDAMHIQDTASVTGLFEARTLRIAVHFHRPNLTEGLNSITEGTWFLLIGDPFVNRHAVGVRKNGDESFLFLDPNFGQSKCSLAEMRSHLKNKYQAINARNSTVHCFRAVY